MSNIKWLKSEIEKWLRDGVVEKSTADIILSRYQTTSSRLSISFCVVSVIAALLIGLSVIAFFAANWSFFSREIKLFVSIVPVILCSLAQVVAKKKSLNSVSLWEGLGILTFISAIAGVCLVEQTYHIGGRVSCFILFIALLTYPIQWTTRSVVAMVMWLQFPLIWAFVMMKEYQMVIPRQTIAILALIFSAASLPSYILFLRSSKPRFLYLLGQTLFGFSYSLGSSLIIARCFFLEEGVVLLLWFVSILLLAAAKLWKLDVWTEIAIIVATCTSLCTPFMDTGLYIIAVVIAIMVTVWGIIRLRNFKMNLGLILLFWLILFKFFSSRAEFTTKALLLFLSGVLLLVLNVFLARKKKRIASNEN